MTYLLAIVVPSLIILSTIASAAATCDCTVSPGDEPLQSCIDSAIASTVVICAASGTYAANTNLSFGTAKTAASVAVRNVVLRSQGQLGQPHFPQLLTSTCTDFSKCTAPLYGDYSLRLEGLNVGEVVFSAASESTAHVHLSASLLTHSVNLFNAASMTLDGVTATGAMVSTNRLTVSSASYLPTLFKNCNFTKGSTIRGQKGESMTFQNVQLLDSTMFINQVESLNFDHCLVSGSSYGGIVMGKCRFSHTTFEDNHVFQTTVANFSGGGITINGDLDVSASTIGCNRDGMSNYVPLFQRFGSGGLVSTSGMDLLQNKCPIKCPMEMSSPSGGLFQCSVCGYPGVVWNATFCGPCPGGTAIPLAAASLVGNCAPCPAGSFVSGDSDTSGICGSCISPEYQDQPGQTSCLTCAAPGHTLPQTIGATQCTNCSTDGKHYWDSIGGGCQSCGFFGTQPDDLDGSCSFSKSPALPVVVGSLGVLVVGSLVFVIIIFWKSNQRKHNKSNVLLPLKQELLDDEDKELKITTKGNDC